MSWSRIVFRITWFTFNPTFSFFFSRSLSFNYYFFGIDVFLDLLNYNRNNIWVSNQVWSKMNTKCTINSLIKIIFVICTNAQYVLILMVWKKKWKKRNEAIQTINATCFYKLTNKVWPAQYFILFWHIRSIIQLILIFNSIWHFSNLKSERTLLYHWKLCNLAIINKKLQPVKDMKASKMGSSQSFPFDSLHVFSHLHH